MSQRPNRNNVSGAGDDDFEGDTSTRSSQQPHRQQQEQSRSSVDRLTRGTAASRAHAAGSQSSVERQVQDVRRQMEFVDVRDEVERMYAGVLESLGEDRRDQPSFSPPRGGDSSVRCPCGRHPCPCRLAPADGPCACGEDPCPCRMSTTDAAMRSLGMSISRLRTNTFGSARRDVASARVTRSDAPGPGSYGTGGDARRNIGAAASSSSRSATGTGGGGGPRWTTPSRQQNRGGAFDVPRDAVPGPGEYTAAAATPRQHVSSKKGSMSRASTGRDTTAAQASSSSGAYGGGGGAAATPGPGAYDADAHRSVGSSSARSAGSGSGGGSGREAKKSGGGFGSSTPRMLQPKSDAPGPNAYPKAAEAAAASKSRAPTASIPSAKRELHPEAAAHENTPGPGQYDSDHETLGASFSARDAQNSTTGHGHGGRRTSSPSPAMRSTTPRSTDVMFSTGEATPGPAAYDTTSSRQIGGTGSGAGAPSFAHGSAAGSTSIPSREAMQMPGPGAYTPRELSQQHHTPGGVLPLAPRRTDPSPREAADQPGPTDYEGAVNAAMAVRPRSASPVIGSALRKGPSDDKEKRDMPAPGAYNSHEVYAMHPHGGVAFSQVKRPLAGGLVESDAVQVPGPGTYDSPMLDVTRDAAKGVVVGDAARFPPSATNVPGPGTYETYGSEQPNKPDPRVVTIPQADHGSVLDPPNSYPGPGAYLLGQPPLPPGPAAVIGSQMREPSSAENAHKDKQPGPGHYDTATSDFDAARRSATIGEAAREPPASTTDSVPGPGTYDVDTNYQNGVNLPGAAAVTSQRQGIPLVGDTPDTVGPAAYDLPKLPPGTSAVIGKATVPEPPNASNPGPGTYHVDEKNPPVGPVTIPVGPGHEHDPAQVHAASVPGPGHYELPAVNDPRAASIGNAERNPSFERGGNADIPGPASYDPVPVLPTAPQVSISAGPRHIGADGESCAPGPAAYDPRYPNEKEVPAISFGNAQRWGSEHEKDEPGPAAYDVAHIGGIGSGGSGAPAVTIGNAPRSGAATHDGDDGAADVPGPGQYDLPPPAPLPGAVSFGGAPRPDLISTSDAPGPGMYALPDSTGAGVPAVSFGTAARDPPKESDNFPGPAHYHTFTTSLSQRAVSFMSAGREIGGAIETMIRATGEFPGPGQYDPYTRYTDAGDAINVYFGTAPRDANGGDAADGPGPGYYQLPDLDRAKGGAFGKAIPEKDRELEEAANKPGPGWYSLPDDTNEGRAPSFGTAMVVRNAAPSGDPDNPGPGFYALPDLPPLHPGVSIKGRNLPPDPAQDNPGPGYYQPSDLKDVAPHISFKTAPRLTEGGNDPDAPGPGHYDTKQAFEATKRQVPSLTIGTSPQRPREDCFDNPGPGQYDLGAGLDATRARQVQPVSFTTAPQRPREDNFENPGPGQYQYSLDSDIKNVHIGTGPRFERSHNEDVPGPGHYDLAHLDRDESKAVSFGTAPISANRAPDDAPGPGQYTVPHEAVTGPRAPAWTIISRPNLPEPNADVPGPGTYYNDPVDGRDAQNHGPTIGTAPRQDIVATGEAAQKPGPGYYDARAAFEATMKQVPMVSMTFKQAVPDPNQYFPGPGYYNSESCDALRFPSTPLWTIGKAPLPSMHIFDAEGGGGGVPGPGYYQMPELRNINNGVPMTTAPRFQAGHADDVPGPGSYTVDLPPDGPQIKFGTGGSRDVDVNIAPHSPGAKYNPLYTAVDPNPIAHSIPRSTEHQQTRPPATQAEYNVELPRPGPVFSFPRADPHPMPYSASPGPIYTVPPPAPSPMHHFGKDPRFRPPPEHPGPGPGEYNPPSTIRVIEPVDMSRGILGGGGGAIAPRSVNTLHTTGGRSEFVRTKASLATEPLPGSPAHGQLPVDQVGTAASPQQQQQQQSSSPPAS